MATRRSKTKITPTKKVNVFHNSRDVAPIAQASPSKTTTQSRIGLIYVWGFLIIIGGVLGISLIIAPFIFKPFTVADIKDLTLAISGVLSGPLGFIIGFYFKEEVQKEK